MPRPIVLSSDDEGGDGPPLSPSARPSKRARANPAPKKTASKGKKRKAAEKEYNSAFFLLRHSNSGAYRNVPITMSPDERVAIAKEVNVLALNIAKTDIVGQTLAQRAARIDIKKKKIELELSKQQSRQTELELELQREKAAEEKAKAVTEEEQHRREVEKLKILRDTAIANAQAQHTQYYQPPYFPQPHPQFMYGNMPPPQAPAMPTSPFQSIAQPP